MQHMIIVDAVNGVESTFPLAVQLTQDSKEPGNATAAVEALGLPI